MACEKPGIVCENYDYVRFTFPDMHGLPRGKTIPMVSVEDALKNGVGAWAGVLAFDPQNQWFNPERLEKLNSGNVLFTPQSHIYPLPWAGYGKYHFGEVLCEPKWTHNDTFAPSSRTAAREQLQRLKDEGFQLMAGSEMEFVLEDIKTGLPVFNETGIYDDHFVTKCGDLLLDAEKKFQQVGIITNAIHTEVPGPGKFEFALRHQPGITAADQDFIFKHGMREMAERQGLQPYFMYEASLGSISAQHFNHSLWSEDLKSNMFYDAGGHFSLSEIAFNWIGGLCKHGPAITALCSPTTNAYRLNGREFMPVKSDWGVENREMAYRIKNHSASGCLIENRFPVACNPYLLLAATVAAGLDGIINKTPCPVQNDPEASPLPSTLAEALDRLQDDKVIVDALGHDLIKWFIEDKRQVDLKIMADYYPTDDNEAAIMKERQLYSRYT